MLLDAEAKETASQADSKFYADILPEVILLASKGALRYGTFQTIFNPDFPTPTP